MKDKKVISHTATRYNVHMHVACPRCGSPAGERCKGKRKPRLHHHKEWWASQLVRPAMRELVANPSPDETQDR